MTLRVSDIVPFSEARSRLSELVIEVAAGAQKVITKNGAAVAALIKAEELDQFNDLKRAQAAIAAAASVTLPPSVGKTLTEMVRDGTINFHQVVERLSTRGYIIEGDPSTLLPCLPETNPAEFDRLLTALYPGVDILIDLASASTSEGSEDGTASMGWFNRALCDVAAMEKSLVEFNRTRGSAQS